MGEVVSMADWRKQKAKPVFRGGIEFTYKKSTVEEAMMTINTLLQQSHDVMSYIPQLRSVQAREQAVLDSMRFREHADKVARDNGWVICKDEDNRQYVVRPKEQS